MDPQTCDPSVLESVETLASPPVPGRLYRVPCVWSAGEWMPVTGPRHADLDLPGGALEHRHIDYRFMEEGLVRAVLFGTSHKLCAFLPLEVALQCVFGVVTLEAATPVLRALRCLRAQPLHPGDANTAIVEARLLRLGDKARLTPEGLCPHQRLPVLSQPLLPREGDGLLVRTCPGHGAQFDEAGRLVARCPRDSAAPAAEVG